jgi:Common central domain of tyrosinase
VAASRRDVNSLSEAELSDYIHAIDILRKRSTDDPDDPEGYDYQAALHNDHLIGPCEHGNDRFFAWHRAHLHYFEQLLRAADPPRTANVAIPYWDWIHPEERGRFPAAFDKPGLFAEGRNLDPDAKLPADTLAILTEERSWAEFGGYPEDDPTAGERPDGNYGRLERGPHNYMHSTFIDGKMGVPATAAEDPIYFSFHCFIDLIWAEWQRRNDKPPPTSPDVDLRGFLDQPMHKIRDFHDLDSLGTEYQYTDKLKDAFEVEPPARAPMLDRLLAAEPLQPAFDDTVASVLRSRQRLDFAVPAVPEAPTAVVRLDLNVPKAGSYTLYAYLHPSDVPFAPDDRGFSERWFLGYTSVWRGHDPPDVDGPAGHAHHPSTLTTRFDATDVLSAASDANDLVLTLDWVPAPSRMAAREVAPRLADEVELEDIAIEMFE